MFRAALSLSFFASEAYRLDLSDQLAVDSDIDLTAVLLAKENATYNKDCDTERFWPPAMRSKYKNGRMVGSGATACVAIAEFNGGPVAIKIGKKGSNLDEWSKECDDMKRIRLMSCKNKVLDLHEMFIPTCLDVGNVDYKGEKINYYVMHAAGIEGISQVQKGAITPTSPAGLAAQVIASIYAMHHAGFAHNDLHGNNIVLDKKQRLQLIDLGDAANYPGWIKDYKRDGNAVWRWVAVAAGCPTDAQWFSHIKNPVELKEQSKRFKACLQSKFNPGDDFMQGLDAVVNGDLKNQRQHHVEKLYNTKFVKNNLPKLEKLFPATFSKGCTGWSAADWQTKELESEFANHYKCDQVSTYKSKGAKGKERIQCERGRPHKSGGQGHCFSKRSGVNWGCAGAIDWDGFKAGNKPCAEMGAPGGGYYDGGCLTKEHPGYRVTKNGSP